jgi:hypothetical protein
MTDDGFDTDTPLILHLRGVFRSKNDDDLKFEGYEATTAKQGITYTRFPRKFCGLKTWIENTEIHCFNCTNKFNDRPIPITNSYRKTSNGCGEFNVKGIACSFPCAKKYINKSPKNERWELDEMLRIMFYIFYSKTVSDIPEAYDMYEQEKFGGTKSDSDFKARNKHILDTLLAEPGLDMP